MSDENQGFWRFSIADVSQNGPFSKFPGLSRILTVTEGEGLYLDSPDARYQVVAHEPFAFSGETEIEGVLINGLVQDFNVIFDSTFWSADAKVGHPQQLNKISQGRGSVTALYCLKGTIVLATLGALPATSGNIQTNFSGQISGSKDALCLRIDLKTRH